MKFYLSVLVALIFSINMLQGQSYQRFEFDFGAKFNYLTGDFSGTGTSYFVEPRMIMADNLNLGFHVSIDKFESNISDVVLDNQEAMHFLLFGDYFLGSTSNNRAFLGLGVGMGAHGLINLMDPDPELNLPNQLTPRLGGGYVLRAGYKYSVVKAYLSWTLNFDTGARDFLSLNVAMSLGGRYKD